MKVTNNVGFNEVSIRYSGEFEEIHNVLVYDYYNHTFYNLAEDGNVVDLYE